MKQRTLFIRLNSISSKKGVLLLFLMAHFALLLMMTTTFPRINAQIGDHAFDLRTFGYTLADAEIIVQNLDESAKQIYLFPQLLLLDILYPALLALFLSTLTIRLGNLCNLPSKRLVFIAMVPFITMFFDYLENTFIILMITETIELSSKIVSVASICTQLKSGITTISWLIILGLFGYWMKGKLS